MKKLTFTIALTLFVLNGFSQKRPYYGGGHHTNSHGGSYPGSENSHHKGGHYKNENSNDRYGIHSTSRKRKN